MGRLINFNDDDDDDYDDDDDEGEASARLMASLVLRSCQSHTT